MKICIVTQARVGSTRFAQKVLKPIGDTTLLGLHLQRLKKSRLADMIIVATTREAGVEQIVDIAESSNVHFYQGSTEDVLDRFYQAVRSFEPDYIVRVTSDCPLVDPVLIDAIISFAMESNVDYAANILEEVFPDGQDIEVFTFSALEKAWKEAQLLSEREHVTPFIRNNSNFMGGRLFSGKSFSNPINYNHVRMTVDEEKDYNTIVTLVSELGTDKNWEIYTDFILNNPTKFHNQKITRNEGYFKSLNQDHE